jgi:hypothetical protein
MGRDGEEATGGHQVKKLIAGFVLGAAAISLAAGDDARLDRIGPAEKMAVESGPEATRSSASLVPEVRGAWLPMLAVPAMVRAPHLAPAIKEPAADAKLPPLLNVASAAPGRPEFGQGARILVTPMPAMTPRIPNLLTTQRKAAQSSGNPVIAPAAAVMTPPVNNLQGTAELPALPSFAREIQVEIAPLPAPLSFDREPYLQSPEAPDDLDAPANSGELPERVTLK